MGSELDLSSSQRSLVATPVVTFTNVRCYKNREIIEFHNFSSKAVRTVKRMSNLREATFVDLQWKRSLEG